MAQCLKSYLRKRYACEIGIYTQVSSKALFMHTVGVVIGDGVILEEVVKIYNCVSLGRKNVVIGCGSSVLDNVTIEEDCVIGANTVVVNDCNVRGGVYIGAPAILKK